MMTVTEPAAASTAKALDGIPSAVLDAFWALRDADKNTRAVGALQLASALCTCENDESLEKLKKYASNRLVSGLGSLHPEARAGFLRATTITPISVELLLDAYEKCNATPHYMRAVGLLSAVTARLHNAHTMPCQTDSVWYGFKPTFKDLMRCAVVCTDMLKVLEKPSVFELSVLLGMDILAALEIPDNEYYEEQENLRGSPEYKNLFEQLLAMYKARENIESKTLVDYAMNTFLSLRHESVPMPEFLENEDVCGVLLDIIAKARAQDPKIYKMGTVGEQRFVSCVLVGSIALCLNHNLKNATKFISFALEQGNKCLSHRRDELKVALSRYLRWFTVHLEHKKDTESIETLKNQMLQLLSVIVLPPYFKMQELKKCLKPLLPKSVVKLFKFEVPDTLYAHHTVRALCVACYFVSPSTIDDLVIATDLIYKSEIRKDLVIDDPQPEDVIVDAMLALCSQPNRWLRNLCTAVFRGLVFRMTASTCQLLLDALGSKEEQEEDSEDEEQEEEEDSEKESGSESGESEDDDDENEDEDEGEEEEEEIEDADKKVSTAFLEKTFGMQVKRTKETTDGSSDDDDDDGDCFDDEKMMQMDHVLGALVRRKKSEFDAARGDYLMRVLEWLEIYAERCGLTTFDQIKSILSLLEQQCVPNNAVSRLYKVLGTARAGINAEKSDIDETLAKLLLLMKQQPDVNLKSAARLFAVMARTVDFNKCTKTVEALVSSPVRMVPVFMSILQCNDVASVTCIAKSVLACLSRSNCNAMIPALNLVLASAKSNNDILEAVKECAEKLQKLYRIQKKVLKRVNDALKQN